MKIGIFMAYMPGVKLGSEGLGRYIGNLMKGFLDGGNQISVACPKWLLESLFDLFDDFHIRKDQVNIITTQRVPVIWTIYNTLFAGKKKKQSLGKIRLMRGFSDLVDFLINRLISFSGWVGFILFSLLLVAVGLLLLPFALLGATLLVLLLLARALLKKSKDPVKSVFRKLSRIYKNYSKSGTSIPERAYKALYLSTVEKIIHRINQEPMDVWFVPTLFWPEAVNIRGLTVFAAPDMVTTEFPFPFADEPSSVTATDTCAKTIYRGSYFISYGDFIKRDVLMKRFGKREDHIISIAHINNSSLEYVDIVEGTEQMQESGAALNERFCRQLLRQLPRYTAQRAFLEGFDFEHLEFVFYASQQRPHKNIMNLLKAYEYLVRTKHVRFKLFVTADLEGTPALDSFIREHHLEHDVIAFKRVPVQLLSALYACARLVVNPTLYEGAFLTFTIGEGMSVGTPSIMGRIPQVTDTIPSVYPLEHVLFDPHDYMDMADKILYGVEHAEELYEDELPMYRDIESRTGPIVSKDYIDAFHHFAEIYRAEGTC